MTAKEAMKESITRMIGNDKNHGWGVDDSLECIAAIWQAENGDALPTEVAALIREVINPSAFRQKLEGKGLLNEKPTPKQKAKSIVDDLLA